MESLLAGECLRWGTVTLQRKPLEGRGAFSYALLLCMDGGQNRMNPPFVRDVTAALDLAETLALRSSEDKGILATTGAGRYYSTGVDLDYMAKHREEAKSFMPDFVRLVRRLVCFPMPTVAVLNGHCYAGALMMAFAHDYRFMNEDPQFGFCLPALKLGLVLPRGLLALAQARAGSYAAARAIVLEGRRLSGPQAVTLGAVDGAAPASSLLASAFEHVASCSVPYHSGPVMRSMKEALYKDICTDLEVASAAKRIDLSYANARSRL